MITITIDEYVNGYSIKGYDNKDGYFLNEVAKDRVEALKPLERWVRCEIIRDLQRRNQNAS